MNRRSFLFTMSATIAGALSADRLSVWLRHRAEKAKRAEYGYTFAQWESSCVNERGALSLATIRRLKDVVFASR